MDRFLRWYNHLPSRNLLAAVVAAFALVAAFQAFASSGEYRAAPADGTAASAIAWSAPGRYFLECAPAAAGAECQFPRDDQLAVYADGNYAATYQTIDLPAGAYTLTLQYGSVGPVLPDYSFSVRARVNGQPISAGTDGTVALATDSDQPWSAEFPVTLPGGVTTISLEWINQRTGEPGGDPNFLIRQLSLSSQAATEAAARNDDRRRQDLNRYREALARHLTETGSYPAQPGVQAMTRANQPFAALSGTYLTEFLSDPIANRSYYFVSNGTRYGLCADLESERGVRYEVGPSGSRQSTGPARECTLLN